MKKVYLCLLFLASFGLATSAQHCASLSNSIMPLASAPYGFSPADSLLSCFPRTVASSDTIYFKCYSSLSIGGGNVISVDSVRIDSVYLPSGLCWTTNKVRNTFGRNEVGVLSASGAATAAAGQYKTRVIGTIYIGAGGGVLPNFDLGSVINLPKIRVRCQYNACASYSYDTSSFVADTRACIAPPPTATITVSGQTRFCQGDSVILSAPTTPGYSYQWSGGSTAQSLTVKTNGTYTVTVTSAGGTAVATPVIVTVGTPLASYSITPAGPTTFCNGQNVTLDAGSGFISYHWSTGSNLSSITAFSTGAYSVVVVDTNHCTYRDTINVTRSGSVFNQQLCIVTVDSGTGKNLIVWDKTSGSNVDSFRIYRESSVAGSYQQIGQQPFATFSAFLDVASNPAQQSNKYVITAINSCGESSYSLEHQTIHLTSNLGVGGVVNLLWNAYVGFSYSSFNIYRGSSISALQLISTVSSGNFSYTDVTPPAPPLFYAIEAVNPGGCTPSRTSNYSSSVSNVINITQTGVSDIEANTLSINYYADAIHFSQFIGTSSDVRLYDMSGRVVMKQSNFFGSSLGAEGIASGVYVIVLQNSTMNVSRKLNVIR